MQVDVVWQDGTPDAADVLKVMKQCPHDHHRGSTVVIGNAREP